MEEMPTASSKRSIPPFILPDHTIPVITDTVRSITHDAAHSLTGAGKDITSAELSAGAAILAKKITLQRKIGIGIQTAGALGTFAGFTTQIGKIFPYIKIAGPCICLIGTAICCDTMYNCCCKEHKRKMGEAAILKRRIMIAKTREPRTLRFLNQTPPTRASAGTAEIKKKIKDE